MGMGHREYKVRDPRARHLEAMAQELSVHVGGDDRWYQTARALEDASRKVLQEKKPDNTIYANVDFYTAPVLADLGIPGDEFTCLFACGRIAGWTAHVLEQTGRQPADSPASRLTMDPPAGPYVPIEQRSAATAVAARVERARCSSCPRSIYAAAKCVRMKRGDPTTTTSTMAIRSSVPKRS